MKSERKYFEMFFRDRPFSFAVMPEEYYYEYDSEKMKSIEKMPFNFVLEEGKMDDFLDNDLNWPLMSSRMKLLFDNHNKNAPLYKWVSVWVDDSTANFIDYYFLVWLERPDVLDLQKTRMIDDSYIYAYFNYEKIKNFTFFPHTPEFKKGIIISEDLKKEIVKQELSGVEFERADVV